MADIRYHNRFKFVGSDKKVPAPKGPKAVAAAASSHVDKQEKEWNNPYEWLGSFNIKSVKKRWQQSLAGYGFCLICHWDKDRHAPATFPLLVELNLKLIRVSLPAGSPTAAPAPVASPTPGGCSAVAYEALALGLAGSATAPSGLVATVAEEYYSDDDFRWEGNESGVEFGDSSFARKSNNNVAFYPSCNHVVVEAISPVSVCPVPTLKVDHDVSTILPSVFSSCCINLSKKLMSLIANMSASSILLDSHHQFMVANLGTTNHMFPDKLAFVSYKLVSNLCVRMGNNSYLPVFGRGWRRQLEMTAKTEAEAGAYNNKPKSGSNSGRRWPRRWQWRQLMGMQWW